MLSYLIVGSGYRAEFYGRIAAAHPDLFSACFLCRSQEKAARMTMKTGVPAVTSEQNARAFSPDAVVIAVNKDAIADATEHWIRMGFPVMTETPCGNSWEKLQRLWALYRDGARLTTCEQYHRYPVLLPGLAAVAAGTIGVPQSAYLSLAHTYHAASLLRRMLLAEDEGYVLQGMRMPFVAEATDSRQGPIRDGRQHQGSQDALIIRYSLGKQAVYDFSGMQYHSFIRSRHLTVRGARGEWTDRMLLWTDEAHCPQYRQLEMEVPKGYECLITPELARLQARRDSTLTMENAQDEFAMASLLLDLKNFVQDGKEPYPFREALKDAAMALLMEEAWTYPGREISQRAMPWD